MDINTETNISGTWRKLKIENYQKYKGNKANLPKVITKKKSQKRLTDAQEQDNSKNLVQQFISQIEQVGIIISKQASYDNKINDLSQLQKQNTSVKPKEFNFVAEHLQESIEMIEENLKKQEAKEINYEQLQESFVQRLKISDQNLIEETQREDEISQFSSQHRKQNLNKLLESNKNYVRKIIKCGKIIRPLLQQLKKQVVTIKQQVMYQKKQFQLYCILAPIDFNEFVKYTVDVKLNRIETADSNDKISDLKHQIQEKQREICYLNFKISELKNENNQLNQKVFDFNQKVIQADLVIQQKVHEKVSEIIERKFRNLQNHHPANETTDKQLSLVARKQSQVERYQQFRLIGNVFQNLHTNAEQEERKSRDKSLADNSISKFYKTINLSENSKIMEQIKNHSKSKQKQGSQIKGLQQSSIHKKSIILNKRPDLKISIDEMDSQVQNSPQQQSSIPQAMWNNSYVHNPPYSPPSHSHSISGLNDFSRPFLSPKYKTQTPTGNSSRNYQNLFHKSKLLTHVKSQSSPFQPYDQLNSDLQKSKHTSGLRQTYRNNHPSTTNYNNRNHVIFSKGFHGIQHKDILDSSAHGRRNGGSKDRDWSKGTRGKQHSLSRDLRFKNQEKISQLGSKIDQLRDQIKREIIATNK